MGILDFYRDAFVRFGYPPHEVDSVIAAAPSEADYGALVATLHARERGVAGAASRESAHSHSPVSPLLELLGAAGDGPREFARCHGCAAGTPAAAAASAGGRR
jgi:hypothetical protein